MPFSPNEPRSASELPAQVTTDSVAEAQQPGGDFASLGLSAQTLESVRRVGFTTPSEVQRLAIPVALTGKDLVAKAKTGTGKTAAFGLPCLDRMERGQGAQLLVLTPTRELAVQVAEELRRFGDAKGLRTVAVYGGSSSQDQIYALNKGAEVVVGTPGRLLDLMGSGKLHCFEPQMVVIDEADEMLQMGFIEDVRHILNQLPVERQTLLFSATMPPPILALTKTLLKSPAWIDLTDEEKLPESIEQRFYVVPMQERAEALIRLIEAEAPEKAIVFCRTRRDCDELTTMLVARSVKAKALHGDMDQDSRNAVTVSLKKGRLSLIVATDVAARGLHVENLTHVFNFELPHDAASYVHRVGRTGRSGSDGKALSLIGPHELGKLRFWSRQLGARMVADEVPSLSLLREKSLRRFEKRVVEQQVGTHVEAIMQRLAKDSTPEELAAKLVALVLSERDMAGSSARGEEQIGYKLGAIQRLMNVRSGGRPPYDRGRNNAPMDRRGRPARGAEGHHRQGGRKDQNAGGFRRK